MHSSQETHTSSSYPSCVYFSQSFCQEEIGEYCGGPSSTSLSPQWVMHLTPAQCNTALATTSDWTCWIHPIMISLHFTAAELYLHLQEVHKTHSPFHLPSLLFWTRSPTSSCLVASTTIATLVTLTSATSCFYHSVTNTTPPHPT